MSKITDTVKYINEVSKFHNFYYDYSLVIYKNAHTKIKIVCPIHGIFEQTPHNHRRYGCGKCGKLLNEIEVLKRIKKIHGDKFGYENFKYTGMNNKSIITCKIHGDFSQIVLNHLKGKGCSKCAKNYKKTKNQIVKKLNIIHNNKYDYSMLNFKTVKDNVIIGCPKHDIFTQILNNHLRGHGCPLCNDSKGEKAIEKYLIENKIKFQRQKKFETCRDKNMLSFDFYLKDYNICLEYDGAQHFYDVLNWNNLEYTKNHDAIKNEFCLKNNILLFRISYKENIIDKLEKVKKRIDLLK